MTVDPIVQVALIVSVTQMGQFLLSRRDARKTRQQIAENALVTQGKVDGVAHAMNHLLDERVGVAQDLGAAQGKAAGVEQERNRPK